MKTEIYKHIEVLVNRYPVLNSVKDEIVEAYFLLVESYKNEGKLLIAGNGGSAADAEHIVGELMKGFKLPRKLNENFTDKLISENEELGTVLAESLQGALPAIALDGHPALSTAYMNDCEPLLCFAQQVNGYGKAGDVFLGISTSGNSKNILYAATTAHAKGMKVIGLTGAKESAAGVYSLAYSMAMILSMINTSILQAIRPWVFQRIKAGEKEKIQPVVVSAILVVAFCNIMLISFAPELVAIFAPGSYSGAIDLMPPITLAVLFAFLYNLFVDIEMYFEKTKSVMNIAIVCAAINLITNYFGIMWFGYAAVAYTTLACYILMAILHYCSMERMLRKNNIKGKIYDAKIIVAISLAYVLIGTVMSVLSGHLFLRLIVMAILAVVLYLNRSRFTQIFVLIKNKRH